MHSEQNKSGECYYENDITMVRNITKTGAGCMYLGLVEAVAVHLLLDGSSNDVGHSAVDVDRVRGARRQVLAECIGPHTSNTINVVRLPASEGTGHPPASKRAEWDQQLTRVVHFLSGIKGAWMISGRRLTRDDGKCKTEKSQIEWQASWNRPEWRDRAKSRVGARSLFARSCRFPSSVFSPSVFRNRHCREDNRMRRYVKTHMTNQSATISRQWLSHI